MTSGKFTPAAVERMRRQYRRLVIAELDFQEAIEFGRAILAGCEVDSLHPSLEVELRALNLALLVSYCRPFVNSKTGTEKPATNELSDRVIDCLTESEKALHRQVLNLRHSELAHSDPDPIDLEVEFVGMFETLHHEITRVPLSRQEVEILVCMIDKLMRDVSGKRKQLRARLEPVETI